MKNALSLMVLAGTFVLCRPALAQDPAPAEPEAAEAPAAAEPEAAKAPEAAEPEAATAPEAAEPEAATAPEAAGPAAAQTRAPPEPEAAKAPEADNAATLELYVGLLPFLEYVDASGPVVRDFVAEPGHIGTASVTYNGVDGAPRARMLGNTSHFGMRGTLRLAEQFTIVGQFETAMAIDGDPNPWEADIPNRNSYLGFKGDWGTLAFGMLDTPYKWITLTTVNPIKGGYVADYTPIIGTPGFLVTAINPAQRWGGSGVSNVAFYRREANSIQYWSPTLWGLSLRASYTINEARASAEEGFSPETNPYIISVGGGWDFEGLRLRYAWETHHDYFGLGYLSQATVPSLQTPESIDNGNKALAQYTLTITPKVKTRIVGIGEYLKYTMAATTPGDVNTYSRPAFYALLEQTVSAHHIWASYGHAYSGECTRVPQADGTPSPCSTNQLGAQLFMAGYMFEFTDKAQLFLAGYHLRNERSALYVTAPALPRDGTSPGLDITGVGLGFYYAFGADLLQ